MINLGGGLGINYEAPQSEMIADFDAWVEAILSDLQLREGQRLHLEPGRSVVGQCGTLVASVLYIKHRGAKTFAILDAGMTELIRPALYGARHAIEYHHISDRYQRYDLVGPICESSDVFAENVLLPELRTGDKIYIRSCGAYTQSILLRYNQRDEVPAVMERTEVLSELLI